jgi:hypothetical protein
MGQNGGRDNLVDEAVAFWDSQFGVNLTREEVRQAVENICGFVSLLSVWDHQSRNVTGQSTVRQQPECQEHRVVPGPPSAAAEVSVAPAETEGGPGDWGVERNDNKNGTSSSQ